MGLYLAILASAAAAQGSGPAKPPETAPEIVVTGERVPRSLRETTSSLAIVTAGEIDAASGADRLDQILGLIPNVQMSSGGEGPTIRGQDTTGPSRDLPAFLGGMRPRTTVIVDGRPVSYHEFIFGTAPLWDVQRIEVFRSPQTTTQGQNSIAGAIFINTQEPSATPEYGARLIVGSGDARQVSGVASGPLGGDLSFRLAADYRYSRPDTVIGKNAVGVNPNRDRYGMARLKLLATPRALPGVKAELIYSHTSSQMPQIEGLQRPFRDRRSPDAMYGTFRINVDALTGRLNYDPDANWSLSALVTAGDNKVQRFAPAGLGQVKMHGTDLTTEAILRWSASPSLSLVGGASHGRRTLDQYINLSVLAGEGRFDDRQRATGIFGEATWSGLGGAVLTAGLRYQKDSQLREGELGTSTSVIPLDFDRDFDAWLPKVSLSYDFTPDLRAGVLVQRGYNPGGVTMRFDTGAPDPFEAENLWDYELFARGRLAGGAVTFSANAFYYDIRNAQRAQPIPIRAPNGQLITFADLFNVPKARSHGVEGQVDWRASGRLSARIGLGYLATKILRVDPANAAFARKEFGRAPRFSGSLALAWRPLDQLRLTAQARHNSGYFSDDANSPTRRIGRATQVDGRAEWDSGRFKLFGYARNVFDNFYLTYMFNSNLATAGDPREAGLGVEARF